MNAETIRIAGAREFFDIFLEYVRVEAPPTILATPTLNGTVAVGVPSIHDDSSQPFIIWPHIQEVIDILPHQSSIIWLKARQIGASWTMAAYALWAASYHEGARVLLFSQGADESKQLLGKAKFIYSHLPTILQAPLYSDNQQEMRFRDEGWYIHALPSTAKAGRSETATLVIFDEADFHEYLDQAYGAVKPTVADVGGQIILLSTSDAKSQESTFKTLYRGAPQNGFHPMFFPWDVRPHRDQEWYDQERLEYDDQFQFEKEYPATDEEALAPPVTLMAFDHRILDAMKQDTRPPVESRGPINIYQPFSPGKRYIAATDTSHGVGQDYSVTVILDTQTGYVVADILDNWLPTIELAYQSNEMLKLYDSPVWAIEDNDWGHSVIEKAMEMRYPSLYWRDDTHAGFRTGQDNRLLVWSGLMHAITARQLVIPNAKGLAQFRDVIKNPDKQGRPEAIKGRNDDYPMAVAIAWEVRSHAKRSKGTYQEPIRVREDIREFVRTGRPMGQGRGSPHKW